MAEKDDGGSNSDEEFAPQVSFSDSDNEDDSAEGDAAPDDTAQDDSLSVEAGERGQPLTVFNAGWNDIIPTNPLPHFTVEPGVTMRVHCEKECQPTDKEIEDCLHELILAYSRAVAIHIVEGRTGIHAERGTPFLDTGKAAGSKHARRNNSTCSP